MVRTHHMHAKAGRAIFARAALCMFAAALVLPAEAQTAQLRDQVKLSESDLDAALVAHPSYRAVVDGIATDCAHKLPDDAKMDGFCRCAAAVTFSIWRSRVDDGDMLNRLNLYIRNPTPAEVQDLLNYADVGIYKSACEKFLGKS
jgi:hypothetical protein